MKKLIAIRIEQDQDKRLRARANRLGITKSELIRRIIRKYVDKRNV